MLDAIRRRHEDLDILANDLLGSILKHPFRSGTEKPDEPTLVDRYDRVGHGIDHGFQPRRVILSDAQPGSFVLVQSDPTQFPIQP